MEIRITSEALDKEESEWNEELRKGKVAEGAVLKRIDELVRKYPENIWVSIRCIRFLRKIGRVDMAVDMVAKGNWHHDTRGETHIRQEARGLIRECSDKGERRSLLRYLASNSVVKGVCTGISATELYIKGETRKAFLIFESVWKQGCLERETFAVWSQVVSRQTEYEQRVHLRRMVGLVQSTNDVNMLSGLMTVSIICGGHRITKKLFEEPVEGLMNRWEYLLWFNRTPLRRHEGKMFEELAETEENERVDKNDFRWLFQYGLLLQRKGDVIKAKRAFRRVYELDMKLGELAVPLIEMLEKKNRVSDAGGCSGKCRDRAITVAITQDIKAICVFFSGWNGGLGNVPDWLLIDEMTTRGYGVVILRDTSQRWFLGKDGEVDEKWIIRVERVKALAQGKGIETILVGSSVTGLSAMEYAAKVEPLGVLNFAGPVKETTKNKMDGTLWVTKTGRKADLRDHVLERRFTDTRTCLKELDDRGVFVTYIYSEGNGLDKRNASIYGQYRNCEIVEESGIETHAVSSYALSRGTLIKEIEKMMVRKWRVSR